MKNILLSFVVLFSVAAFHAAALGAAPVELTGSESAEQTQAVYAKAIGQIVPNLLAPDASGAKQMEELVHWAARPGAEKERLGCCLAIAVAIETDQPPLAKAWLLRQLVNTGKAEVVPVEKKLLAGSDALLREEARRALQQNPASEALAALKEALAGAKDAAWREALTLALYGRGEKVELPARPVPAKSARRAEFVAKIRAAEDAAGPIMVELLRGDDAEGRFAALGRIAFASPAVLKAVAESIDSIPQETRLLVIRALADRREKAAMPAALACAKSDDPAIRLAGVEAMGPLGDAGSLPFLLNAIATGGDLGNAAKASILQLADPAVNAKLVEMLKSSSDETQRGRVLELIEARNAIEAADALLPDLLSDNANVRRSAARALGKLAQPKHVPAILLGLTKAAAGGERDDLEKAIMFVCERIGNPEDRAEPLIAAYADDKIDKTLLLPVIGRVGGAKAAELVRKAAAADSPEIRKAAVRALCNWPDASVAKDMEKLASAKGDPSEAGTALRALVRVVTLKGGPDTKTQIAYLKKAMELAATEQDRSWVIERANNVRHIEIFRMVLPYLDDPKLAVRAGRTICDLAHHGGLRSREKAEYQAALKKIIEVCEKDKGLVSRAKEELEVNK